MSSIMGSLRPMGASDLENVLEWRNDPSVRRFMFTQKEISFEEHRRWYARVALDSRRTLLIYEESSVSLGYVNINRLPSTGAADWGFYVAPNAPKGTGRCLGRAAVNYAFSDMGLHKLCGQALAFNHRSIDFHRMLGFKEEGVLRKQFFDGQDYHDVIYFGLLASEWQQNSGD